MPSSANSALFGSNLTCVPVRLAGELTKVHEHSRPHARMEVKMVISETLHDARQVVCRPPCGCAPPIVHRAVAQPVVEVGIWFRGLHG